MFERFTPRTRRAIFLAQEQARDLRHSQIDPGHILLGLIEEGEGIAAQVIQAYDLPFDTVRNFLANSLYCSRSTQPPSGSIPFTSSTKTVLEFANREALQLGHNYIGTEHLLLAIIRKQDNLAAECLLAQGIKLTDVRMRILQMLSGYTPAQQKTEAASMTEILVAATLAEKMRFAADVLEEASKRYNVAHPASGSWTAQFLRKEARHVEDEDQETAEREAMVEELAKQIARLFGGTNFSNFSAEMQQAYRRHARALIDAGWTKDTTE